MSCYGCFCFCSEKKPPDPPPAEQRHSLAERGKEAFSSTPTLAEVLKSFQDADIATADDFINDIREQLNALGTLSTSSSITDKLSKWPSFLQSGAIFLKFASDHTEQTQTMADFSQSGEVAMIVRDMLQEMGQLHWSIAGISIVGCLVSRSQKVSENRAGYVDLLKEMLKLASYIKLLNNLSFENEHKEVLKNAFQYIVEGSIICACQLDSGFFSSFFKTSINSGTLSGISSKIDRIYQDLQAIAAIENLAEQRKMSAQLPVVLPLSHPDYPKNAVGIEEQVEAVNMLLGMGKSEDCSSSAVVIWGFGGIGKTTLAQAVVSKVDKKNYNYARIELDEISERNNYKLLQQQILKNGFPKFEDGKKIELQDDADGRYRLREAFKSETNKPLFLFIDNALHVRDLEKILPEDLRGLPQRSRILITTRILSVTDILQERGLQRHDHRVETLSDNHAAEILCNDPAIRDGIKDDIEKIIKLCNGVPLVLNMFGAHLRKQEYDVDRCTQILESIQSGGNIKEKDLSNRLFDFVYNQLEESTKEAFLDICCFFNKGFPRRIVEYIVGAEEVALLQEAALITTEIGGTQFFRGLEEEEEEDEDEGEDEQEVEEENEDDDTDEEGEEEADGDGDEDGDSDEGKDSDGEEDGDGDENEEGDCKEDKDEDEDEDEEGDEEEDDDEEVDQEEEEVVYVHDIIRSIGRRLSKSNRIMDLNSWNDAQKDEGKLNGIKGVWLEDADDYKDCMLEERHINLMKETLRILVWCSSVNVTATDAVRFPELRCMKIDGDISWVNIEALDKLGVLECEKLPNKQRVPLKLPKRLRSIRAMEQLAVTWEFIPNSTLEVLDISFSQQNESSNEERDNRETPFYSRLHGLNKLKALKVEGCDSLFDVPQEICKLPQLRRLSIKRCINMERLPQLFPQLSHLDLSGCQNLKALPESFGQLKTLTHFNLLGCKGLKELPSTFGQLEALKSLNLGFCSSLQKLPSGFEQLRSLEYLNLQYFTCLKELPELFGLLKNLTDLNLQGCTNLKELPSTFGKLEALKVLDLRSCSSLEKLPSGFEQLRLLEYLDLEDCSKLESDICLLDGTIKIVQKSEHDCTDCQKGKKMDIYWY